MKEAIERLDEDVVAFTSEVQMLRQEVASNKRRVLWVAVAVGIALLSLIPSSVALWVLFDVANDNRTSARILLECTTPGPQPPTLQNDFRTGHDCYDEGNDRTQDAVLQIVCALKPEAPGCPVEG